MYSYINDVSLSLKANKRYELGSIGAQNLRKEEREINDLKHQVEKSNNLKFSSYITDNILRRSYKDYLS
jgi:hypothetical protein